MEYPPSHQLTSNSPTPSPDEDDHEIDHNTIKGILLILVVLAVYISVGSFMETKKFKFGHETGFILIFGFLLSFLYNLCFPKSVEIFEFSKSLFFDAYLPLIIFATAFNMRRNKFFENITNIAKFGLIGTLITFITYTGLTYAFFQIFSNLKAY
jgi:NhaP-type Na+/H+ or K+/H+ antiporter